MKRRLCSSATFCKAGDRNEPFRRAEIAPSRAIVADQDGAIRQSVQLASGPHGEEARQRLPVHLRGLPVGKRRWVNERPPEDGGGLTITANDFRAPLLR
jgi:hypothetical protein